MDILHQVKDKLEEMKSKYNQEHDDEGNPNHSDGVGMYWSGVFACLKEISFFVDHLEAKEVDLEEKATQLSQKYFPDEENIWARPNIEAHKCKSACIEMVEWLKTQKGE